MTKCNASRYLHLACHDAFLFYSLDASAQTVPLNRNMLLVQQMGGLALSFFC